MELQTVYISYCDTELDKVFVKQETAKNYIEDMNNKEINDVAESNQLDRLTEFDRIREIIQGEGVWYEVQIVKIPVTEEDDDEYITQTSQL